MNLISKTLRMAAGGLITLCALAAAAIVLLSPGPAMDAISDPPPAARSPEMVDVPLADVIAAQGNAALRQIRTESTRLASPDLRNVAVEGEPDTAEP